MASAGHSSAYPENAGDIRLVVDSIPELVWSTRPDGSAAFSHRRWLECTGLSAEQALGRG
jgi:PAS domain-containing protein